MEEKKKSLGIGKGTCLGKAKELKEDEELKVCEVEWTGAEGGVGV